MSVISPVSDEHAVYEYRFDSNNFYYLHSEVKLLTFRSFHCLSEIPPALWT